MGGGLEYGFWAKGIDLLPFSAAQVFRDDCVGSRGLAIQSMHVACMCPRPRVLRAIMALHVSTAELDECEQREHHYADIQLLARTMLPALALLAVSTSSVMQHLKRRARQTLQKLMKDEIAAFTCPEILLLIPPTVEWLHWSSFEWLLS